VRVRVTVRMRVGGRRGARYAHILQGKKDLCTQLRTLLTNGPHHWFYEAAARRQVSLLALVVLGDIERSRK
jgi:hypothetical protein